MKGQVPLVVAMTVGFWASIATHTQECFAQNKFRKPRSAQNSRARKDHEFRRSHERRDTRSEAKSPREASRSRSETKESSSGLAKKGSEEKKLETQFPKGFKDRGDFEKFTKKLHSELIKAGCPEAEVLFQGSSVTGRQFERSTGKWTGREFDVGRKSDFDIALCSKSLFERAQASEIEIHGKTRTEKLGSRNLQRQLGLDHASRSLGKLMDRKVDFKVYESREAALERGPSILVPRNTP